jgi:hypothetical protein
MVWGNVEVLVTTPISNQVTMSAQVLRQADALSHVRIKSCVTDQCNGHCGLQLDIRSNSGEWGTPRLSPTKTMYGDFGKVAGSRPGEMIF